MPKRGLDAAVCEVFRFYRLLTVKDQVEPLSFIVPRKCVDFQDDICPMTASSEVAMTAQEWITGQDKAPVLMSLRPGTEIQNPYPAPEQETHCLKHQNTDKPHQEQPANQKARFSVSDLSEWQEDETQMGGWSESRESALSDNPTAAGKELMNMLHKQQDEIRSLRQQIKQQDSTIQHLELEIKNICNQLRVPTDYRTISEPNL